VREWNTYNNSAKTMTMPSIQTVYSEKPQTSIFYLLLMQNNVNYYIIYAYLCLPFVMLSQHWQEPLQWAVHLYH
jgi:hypothetical protein